MDQSNDPPDPPRPSAAEDAEDENRDAPPPDEAAQIPPDRAGLNRPRGHFIRMPIESAQRMATPVTLFRERVAREEELDGDGVERVRARAEERRRRERERARKERDIEED